MLTARNALTSLCLLSVDLWHLLLLHAPLTAANAWSAARDGVEYDLIFAQLGESCLSTAHTSTHLDICKHTNYYESLKYLSSCCFAHFQSLIAFSVTLAAGSWQLEGPTNAMCAGKQLRGGALNELVGNS